MAASTPHPGHKHAHAADIQQALIGHKGRLGHEAGSEAA
jgi:hypothetical protein